MEINNCKTLIAIARADIPHELLKNILVPAVGLADPDNYWHQTSAHLVFAIAQHQVSSGDLRPERLKETLEGLTVENVLNNLAGNQREYYVGMDLRQLSATVACVHSLLFGGVYRSAVRSVTA